MSGTSLPGNPAVPTASIPSSSFSPIFSVPGTFGGVFICAYISLALYGLLVHQAYKYFSLYRSDAGWLKGLVIVTLILETAVSALHIHLTYFYFVANYGNPLAFFEDVWSINIFATISACIMITCQSFYAIRILLVGPTKFMYVPVVASALLMAGAMAVIYILHHCRTGLKRTDTMINRLIMYTMSTGLLTTIFNILSAILIRVLGMNSWAWLGTMMIAERLYSNSLMAALNSRRFVVERSGEHGFNDRRADPFGTAVRISTVRFDHGPASSATDGELELPYVRMRAKSSGLGGASGSTLGVEKDDRDMYRDG